MSRFSPSAYVEAFHSADTPLLITDLNFLVRDVNRAGRAFTGYTLDDLVGEPVSVVAGDVDIVHEIIETLVRDEPWRGEFVLQTKSGTRVFGMGSAAPLVVDGTTEGYVAVFVDTTKRRRYASTSRVLSRLLRHDLRNELNLLYGYLDRAAVATDNPEALDAIDRAHEQVGCIVARSNRVRQLREILEQSYDAESTPMRLDTLLERSVRAARSRFSEADISLGDIPPVELYADELLSLALDELVENAVVHNDSPTPTVDIDAVDRETDVLVRISDDGPGVPADQVDLIFGREDADALHHGTGLGLFMVDCIVTNYDGTVWVEPSEAGGATFVVRLRRAAADALGRQRFDTADASDAADVVDAADEA
jgi:PAS domain S-box-containing protein